jgi:hypothetical protein
MQKPLEKEYTKIIIAATMVLMAVLGFFFILQLALNTKTPLLISESASMCISRRATAMDGSHSL